MSLTNTSTLGGVLSISGAVTDQTNVLNVQSNALTVTGSGSVGIGTNNPSAALLDVQGNVGGLSARFSDRVQGVAGTGSNDFVVKSQLDSVNSTFDNVFTRGGNIFGLETKLGTNDAQDLIIVSNTLEVARFTSDRAVQFAGVATGSAPAVSSAGTGRIFFDSTNGYFMCSENGGAYFDCFGTGSDAVSSLNLLTGGITLAGTANQVSVADNGTNTITLSLPQDIAVTSVPSFGGLSVSGNASFTGTVSGANATDAAHFVTKSQLDSAVGGVGGGVSSLNSLAGDLTLQGTLDQLSVNTAGSTLTLSLPQSIATTSSVSFAGGSFTGTVSGADGVNAGDFATKGQLDAAIASVGGTDSINNSTTTQTANFNIQSGADTDVTAVLKTTYNQTADLLQLQNSNGAVLTAINKDGHLGIGTSAPAESIHVSSDGASAKLRLDMEDIAVSSVGVIDVSQLGSVTNVDLDFAKNVAVKGSYAYVTVGQAGNLVVIDISDPTTPVQVAKVSDLSGAHDVKIYGNYAFVTALNQNRLIAVNISDPTNPQIVGSISNNTWLANSRGLALSTDGAYSYVNATDRITVINVADPTSPTYVTELYHATWYDQADGDMYVAGNYLYATSLHSDYFNIIDISNPAAPVRIMSISNTSGSYSTDGALGVRVDGDYAYVASSVDSLISIFNISNPAAVTGVGSVGVGSPSYLTKIGDYLYVTSYTTSTITVIDVSNPAAPAVIDTFTSPELNGSHGITAKNNYLYVPSLHADSLTVLGNGLTTTFYTQSWSLGSVRSNDGAFTLQSTNELGNVDALTVLQGGNVGIGVATPDTDLEVLGGLCVSDDAADDCTTAAGSIRADGSITSDAFDLAELYAANAEIAKGSIVSIDSSKNGYVKTAESADVAIGVVSTDPGFVLGWRDNPEFDGAPYVSEVALAGRVPVRVSGPVAVGDPIALSETAGVGEKATTAGQIIGYALSAYDGEGEGTVNIFINLSYWMPSLQDQDAAALQNGDSATFASLNVDGPSTFNGTLTVNGDLNINGHIITGNPVEPTTVEAGPAACSNAQVVIEGNDVAGTVTITTGTSCGVGGVLATITFGQPYADRPRVTLTPGNAAASELRYYRGTSETDFTIQTSHSAADSTEYVFDYQVIQ